MDDIHLFVSDTYFDPENRVLTSLAESWLVLPGDRLRLTYPSETRCWYPLTSTRTLTRRLVGSEHLCVAINKAYSAVGRCRLSLGSACH